MAHETCIVSLLPLNSGSFVFILFDITGESSKGPFTIEMHPEWAPLGAKRFAALVEDSALDGTVIYRVVKDEVSNSTFPY